eukprot:m51a1_g4042 hypothetical protein (387) ;mRNA; f:684553-685952
MRDADVAAFESAWLIRSFVIESIALPADLLSLGLSLPCVLLRPCLRRDTPALRQSLLHTLVAAISRSDTVTVRLLCPTPLFARARQEELMATDMCWWASVHSGLSGLLAELGVVPLRRHAPVRDADPREVLSLAGVELTRKQAAWWDEATSTEEQWSRQQRSTVRRMVERGVPERLRARAWLLMSGAIEERRRRGEGLYRRLLCQQAGDCGEAVKNFTCISLDVGRTFPSNAAFQTDQTIASLFNILRAWVTLSPRVGYYGGMNYVAGFILLVVGDEEVMVQGLYRMGEMVSDFNGWFIQMCDAHRQLFQQELPGVAQHIYDQEGLEATLYLPPLFLLGFVTCHPMGIVVRAWDHFLLLGFPFFVALSVEQYRPHAQRCQKRQDVR